MPKLIAFLLTIVVIDSAFAQRQDTPTYFLPGCNYYIEHGMSRRMPVHNEAFVGGICNGMIASLIQVSRILESPFEFCPPSDVTTVQATRVAVTYMNSIPSRHHESFVVLALESFKKAWPCP